MRTPSLSGRARVRKVRFIFQAGAVAVCILIALPAAGQPTIAAVVNGASFQPLVAPGTIVSIFGQDLSPATAAAEVVPLPVELAGVSVEVGGLPAPLYFVSPVQINVQVPIEATGDRVPFTVRTPNGESTEFIAALQRSAPGVFTASQDGQGPPLLFDADFNVAADPSPGDRLILYATGLGPTSPVSATGVGGAAEPPFNRLEEPLELYIGGQATVVEFAGLAPGFAGVYQVNFVVPDSPNGDRLLIVADGRSGRVTEFPVEVPEPVRGSGSLTTETREVGEFRRVQVIAVAGVQIQVEEPDGLLEIEGDDNVLPLIDATVVDGTLRITASRPYTTTEGPTITITTAALDRVELLGVGRITAEGVDEELFEARINGVGTIEANGAADAVDVISEGAGSVLLFGLDARDARVQLFGAGNVEVTASESLLARVSGVGDIRYAGAPTAVDASVSGVGNIQPR